MPGLVTSDFRVLNAKQYIEMFSESEDNLYFYMGGYTPWTTDTGEASDDYPPSILDANSDHKAVWDEMIALKRILPSDVTHGLKRYDWTAGQVYDRYDDQDGSLYSKKWYVVTSQNQVFACLDNARILSGGNYLGVASTYEPYYDTATPTVTIMKTPDSYIWKYMYSITPSDFLKFTSPSWIPCTAAEDSSKATTGIYSITLSEFGTGYSSDCAVTITGDGTGATAVPVVSGGQITQIHMTNYGSGYTKATVTITGSHTTAASARANTFTKRGIGSRPAYELAAYFVISSIKLQYDEGGVVPVSNQYREFGIIRNPLLSDGTTVASGTLYNMIYTCTVTTSSSFTMDETVSVNGGTARVISYNDSDPDALVLVLGSPSVAVNVGSVVTTATKTATITAITDSPDMTIGSGDVLYAENVSPIYRSTNQSETFLHISEF